MLARGLPEIVIRDDGFLEVDSYFVAIKKQEVACITAFKFPRGWLNRLYSINTTKNSATLLSESSERKIAIHIPELNNKSGKPICATIEWTHFLGLFSSTINWCIGSDKRNYSELSGIDGYKVKWMEIDEG